MFENYSVLDLKSGIAKKSNKKYYYAVIYISKESSENLVKVFLSDDEMEYLSNHYAELSKIDIKKTFTLSQVFNSNTNSYEFRLVFDRNLLK